jgi:hypothetical protein
MSTDLPGVQAVSCVKNRDTTILHSPDMRTRKEGDYYDVRNAISDVGNREYELGDTREPGLGLRVRKTTAAWALRGRLRPGLGIQRRSASKWQGSEPRKLGSYYPGSIDPASWLAEQEHGGPIARTFDPTLDGWTWEQGRDLFLAFVQENRAPATHRDYRRTLMSSDFGRGIGRPLKGISTRDFRRVQEGIWDRGKLVKAHHTYAS